MRALSCLVAAFLVLAVSTALALEFKPFPDAKITPAQWDAYHDAVRAAYGASRQEVAEVKLVLYEGDGIRYAFTQPQHAAHPAWIARRLVQQGGRFNIEQIGYFAGAEAPFAELFRQFQVLNQRMIEELQRQRGK